jgi:hypothetical protein
MLACPESPGDDLCGWKSGVWILKKGEGYRVLGAGQKGKNNIGFSKRKERRRRWLLIP